MTTNAQIASVPFLPETIEEDGRHGLADRIAHQAFDIRAHAECEGYINSFGSINTAVHNMC